MVGSLACLVAVVSCLVPSRSRSRGEIWVNYQGKRGRTECSSSETKGQSGREKRRDESFQARTWKLSSRLFSRPDWLPLGFRGCGVMGRGEKAKLALYACSHHSSLALLACLACSRVPQSPLTDLGKPVEEAEASPSLIRTLFKSFPPPRNL